MNGEIVEVVRYTPGIATGERFVVLWEEVFLRQPMIVVRPLGDGDSRGPYWAWRFRKVLDDVPAPSAPSPAVPAPILRPMSEAPRDGSKIKLHRKPHPNLRYPVVTAYWKHFSAHHGFWFSSALGAIGDDDFVIGWEEI